MVMALGGMMGLLGIPLPGTEYGIAASMILLGGVVLFELEAAAVGSSVAGFVFRDFSRARARNGVASGPGRIAVQHGICLRHRLLAWHRRFDRAGAPVDVGTTVSAIGRRIHVCDGSVFSVEGDRMKR